MFSRPESETTPQPTKSTFTVEQIKAIKTELAKLKPANPVGTGGSRTLKEAIIQLVPTLEKMKLKGFTIAEIVQHLEKLNLKIKPGTLQKYLASKKQNEV